MWGVFLMRFLSLFLSFFPRNELAPPRCVADLQGPLVAYIWGGKVIAATCELQLDARLSGLVLWNSCRCFNSVFLFFVFFATWKICVILLPFLFIYFVLRSRVVATLSDVRFPWTRRSLIKRGALAAWLDEGEVESSPFFLYYRQSGTLKNGG